eukprot:363632-Chlamydomonas_euryale.AAC.6
MRAGKGAGASAGFRVPVLDEGREGSRERCRCQCRVQVLVYDFLKQRGETKGEGGREAGREGGREAGERGLRGRWEREGGCIHSSLACFGTSPSVCAREVRSIPSCGSATTTNLLT